MASSPLVLILIFWAAAAASDFIFGLSTALNIGLQPNPTLNLQFKQQCSKTCESMFCDAPPLLRYGKYCGVLYSGCPGEQPCDPLDSCCMHHDHCISNMANDYLSQKCNKELLKCLDTLKKSRPSSSSSFKGNTCELDDVIQSLKNAMKAAIVAGRVFGKP